MSRLRPTLTAFALPILLAAATPAAALDSQPYLGAVGVFAGQTCPKGFLAADGSTLSVGINQALYALIGNTYGGDDQAFTLPDLSGKAPDGMLYCIAVAGYYPER